MRTLRVLVRAPLIFLMGALTGIVAPSMTHATAGTPALSELQLIGGARAEQGARVAVGLAGSIFLAGSTSSLDWPAHWAKGCALGGGRCTHAFLLKMSPTGNLVYYRVVLGGSRAESLSGLTVDRDGNAYVTGTTTSPDFPTVGPLGPHCSGWAKTGHCSDGFVAKIDPRGNVVYSAFLGGTGDDSPSGIAVNLGHEAYVTGATSSADFPIVKSVQNHLHGRVDSFVLKIDGAGRRLLYSTYLGGRKDDYATGIAVDPVGEAYIAGYTSSPDFRTSRSFGPRFIGGDCTFYTCNDAYVVKLGTLGRFLAGTYIASPGDDIGRAVALDGWGNVYLVGSTTSSKMPSPTLAPAHGKILCGSEGDINPCQSAFAVELSPLLKHLTYSRVLSGDGLDSANAVVAGARGGIIVGGYTESGNFPVVSPIQPATGGGECPEAKGGSAPCDGFVSAISPHGRSVLFSTYLGGNGQDSVESVALNQLGGLVLAGTTWSTNLPTTGGVPASLVPKTFLAEIEGVGDCSTERASLPLCTV